MFLELLGEEGEDVSDPEDVAVGRVVFPGTVGGVFGGGERRDGRCVEGGGLHCAGGG